MAESSPPAPPPPVYVTVSELRQLLNLVAKAPTTIGEANEFRSALDRFVELANQNDRIGACPLPAVVPEGADRGHREA